MSTTMSTNSTAAAEDVSLRPFRIDFPEEDLADLRRRIAATRLPDKEPVPGHSQGVQLETMKDLARYWATDYDLHRCEARLAGLQHFITEIDGLDIHFIHARSPHEEALPLIITHGWPGSIIEMLKVVDLLADPTAHGGSAEDAFHLVIPSMPGYGFSGKPTTTGWDVARMAGAWAVLMKRLGYTRFVAQGGDWGALITDLMGAQAPAGLLGIHSNMPGAVPATIEKTLLAGEPTASGLSDEETRAYDELFELYSDGLGYAEMMGHRPETLSGLADSPVGLATFLIDHDAKSYEDIAQAFRGHPVGELTRDEVLDNVTLYWLTNTAVSSARLYWENKLGFFAPKNVRVPAGVSVFPRELYRAPRSWAEDAYPDLIYFNEVDRGCHFAAWQEPDLFASEVRAAFRSLR